MKGITRQVVMPPRRYRYSKELQQHHPGHINYYAMDLTDQTQFEAFKKWVSCQCSAVDILITKALLPMMNKKSHIVNISSMGGFQGSSKFPGLTAYSVAKGAVGILSECLAIEFADQQISVNALCLGSVQTEMFSEAFPDFEAEVKPEIMGTYIAEFALKNAAFYNGKILPVALGNPS